ncbi:MAG: hypothetical protein COA88_11625 [Kordia sp.]|nr:MAG: hypothetical protein COA88_11625 [Kordia sp.]
MLKDASALFKMNNNPNVLLYTGDLPFKNIKSTEDFIKNYNHYDTSNMGRWAVCGKKQGEFLGWCGLKHHPEKDYVDVGFRFFEKHWNKGFATEATKGVLSYAFNVLRIQDVYAYIDNRNPASMKVVENSGLSFLTKVIHEGNPSSIYHIKNELVNVKEISTEETIAIRHQVLRQGKPIESCSFEGDNLATTFHLGLYYYGELIGVATFIKNAHHDFNENFQFQLRGMAILQQFQGKRLGNVLLEKGLQQLKQLHANLLWCNARENAANFYSKFGFSTYGKPFDIPNIGKHYTMIKNIANTK